jgi:hypothetical protein
MTIFKYVINTRELSRHIFDFGVEHFSKLKDNKMTCPSCKTLSCYLCRQEIADYKHFC